MIWFFITVITFLIFVILAITKTKGAPKWEPMPTPAADCPMCGINMVIDIQGEPERQPYIDAHDEDGWEKLSEQGCPFCKRALALVQSASGKFYLRDIQWDEETFKYDEKEAQLSSQIEELEFLIEDEDGTPKQIEAAKKKLATLQERLEKLEERYEDKLERYTDRQDRWHEKVDNKYGG